MSDRAAPTVSVVVPWCDHPEVARTYAANSAVLEANDAETIFVNSGGDVDALSAALVSGSARHRLVDARTDSFNKCFAVNIGVHCSGTEFVFVFDADILLVEDFLAKAMELCEEDALVSVARVRDDAEPEEAEELAEGDHLARVAFTVRVEDTAGHSAEVVTSRLDWPDRSRNGPGLVILKRRDFIAVNGMNSELRGWGWEDVDLLLRLQLVLGLRPLALGSVVHVRQGGPENRDGPQTEILNRALSLGRYAIGDYRGTLEEDVRQWTDVLASGSSDAKLS